MSPIKRLLVPTDFSPVSDIATEYAIDLAGRFGAAVHLLHVLDDTSYAAAYPDGFYVELPSVRKQLVEEADKKLAALAAGFAARNFTATWQVLSGRPARVIADEAQHRGTDLIVMGTHGRGGFAHLVLGSVAERVLRTAPCPVLAVRDTARVADQMAADAASHQATPA